MSEVIPTEAIEAAADMIGSLRLGDRQKFLTEAQLILEAAAPHIRAEALEEAADAWGYAAAAVWLRTRAAKMRPTP